METTNDKITIEDKTEFWGQNPNTLFLPQQLNELFPTNEMSYERKLNAISRLVIILTLITYISTKRTTILIVCVASLVLIYVIHLLFQQKKKKEKKMRKIAENFANVFQNVEPKKNPAEEVINQIVAENNEGSLEEKKLEYFDMAKSNNPLSNVLLTDYENASEKKHAPPAYTEEGRESILQKTREMIDQMHPDQQPPNTEEKFTDKLFGNLSDNLAFEQSMRQYTSNPSTTIPNDQNAFANFCYGGMISCKEGNAFACVRNNLGRHIMM
jgi:hypothetical protein